MKEGKKERSHQRKKVGKIIRMRKDREADKRQKLRHEQVIIS